MQQLKFQRLQISTAFNGKYKEGEYNQDVESAINRSLAHLQNTPGVSDVKIINVNTFFTPQMVLFGLSVSPAIQTVVNVTYVQEV